MRQAKKKLHGKKKGGLFFHCQGQNDIRMNYFNLFTFGTIK